MKISRNFTSAIATAEQKALVYQYWYWENGDGGEVPVFLLRVHAGVTTINISYCPSMRCGLNDTEGWKVYSYIFPYSPIQNVWYFSIPIVILLFKSPNITKMLDRSLIMYLPVFHSRTYTYVYMKVHEWQIIYKLSQNQIL